MTSSSIGSECNAIVSTGWYTESLKQLVVVLPPAITPPKGEMSLYFLSHLSLTVVMVANFEHFSNSHVKNFNLSSRVPSNHGKTRELAILC